MSVVVSADLMELAHGGPAVLVGTRDAALIPAMTRGWGLRILPEAGEARVTLANGPAARVLDNLRTNQHMAITIVRPTTYRGYQLKGRVLGIVPSSPSDVADVTRHRESFLEEVSAVGIQRRVATRLIEAELAVSPVLITCWMRIEAVFDQTPGVAAGKRL
jgi:hypothetical protein